MTWKITSAQKILFILVLVSMGLLIAWSPCVASSFPGPADIQNCNDCDELDVDVNDSGYVTVSDLLIILRDVMGTGPNNPDSDVNGDTNVDMDDFAIARKCLGCEIQSSPFN